MDSSLITAFKIFITIISLFAATIGVAGVPGDVAKWRSWIETVLSKLDQHNARWILTISGLVIIGLCWLLPWNSWLESSQPIVVNSQQATASKLPSKPAHEWAIPLPKGATLQRATRAELAKDEITARAFYLSDVPRDSLHWQRIRGKEFIDCQIFGPAVVEIADCYSDGTNSIYLGPDAKGEPDEKSVRWPRDADSLAIGGGVGAIECEFCGFSGCSLFEIGFSGSQEALEKLNLQRSQDVAE